MQQLQTHLGWFKSFRYLRISTSLLLLLLLFVLANATIYLLAREPQNAQAQSVTEAATPTPAYDKVSIPSIGLSSRSVTVGLTNTDAIDVHSSLVGWWNGSSQPGTPGAVFLDGHNPGVFSDLPSIQMGAQISIAKANGEVFNYTVVHRETVQLAGIDMRQALSPYRDAAEGLNLMTCVGAYNDKTGTTDQRLVVYAIRS